jgi:hypothetical protein
MGDKEHSLPKEYSEVSGEDHIPIKEKLQITTINDFEVSHKLGKAFCTKIINYEQVTELTVAFIK